MVETITDVATEIDSLPGTELLPDLKHDIVPYDQVDEAERNRIDRLMSEIDLGDSNSIIFFGSKAQQELTSISDSMLEGVRNKDLGSAGDSQVWYSMYSFRTEDGYPVGRNVRLPTKRIRGTGVAHGQTREKPSER